MLFGWVVLCIEWGLCVGEIGGGEDGSRVGSGGCGSSYGGVGVGLEGIIDVGEIMINRLNVERVTTHGFRILIGKLYSINVITTSRLPHTKLTIKPYPRSRLDT